MENFQEVKLHESGDVWVSGVRERKRGESGMPHRHGLASAVILVVSCVSMPTQQQCELGALGICDMCHAWVGVS